MRPHERAHPTVAAYVLGLAADDERDRFRAHLAACSPCREAWLRLRDLPPLLALAGVGGEPTAGLDAAAWERVRGHRVET